MRERAHLVGRLGRIGIVRLSVLHYYLLTESEEETHARTPRRKPEKKTQTQAHKDE
jgi:hypothetical protein